VGYLKYCEIPYSFHRIDSLSFNKQDQQPHCRDATPVPNRRIARQYPINDAPAAHQQNQGYGATAHASHAFDEGFDVAVGGELCGDEFARDQEKLEAVLAAL